MLDNSQIIRLAGAGQLNTVDDTVVGGAFSGSSDLGQSLYAGQLGKAILVDQSEIAQLTDTTVGTLYGATYQYVQLSEASAAVVVGQAAFWDVTAAANLFRVTDDPTQGTINGSAFAGVFINAITPGNYGFIVTRGQVPVQLIDTVTDTTIGSALVVSVVSSPANHALFDAINDNSGASDNPNLNVGWAATAPSNGGLCVAELVNVVQRR